MLDALRLRRAGDRRRATTGGCGPTWSCACPAGGSIVVDAKAPLGAYLEAREAADDDDARREAAPARGAGARAHREAGARRATGTRWTPRPSMVVMFLPGEPLYSVALEQMPELIEEGVRAEGAGRDADDAARAAARGQLRLARGAAGGERAADQRRGAAAARAHRHRARAFFADLGRALGQSVKHFNAAMVSFDRSAWSVSARRLDELDAKGKKELRRLERRSMRAPFTVRPADEAGPSRASGCRSSRC